jgi:SAM-dependent methyltransferase
VTRPGAAPTAETTTNDAPISAAVDGDGVRVPENVSGVLDVLIEGERVWSFDPVRDRDGRGVVAWPPVLQPYLHGSARIVVRGHADGPDDPPLLDVEHAFDEQPGRVAVVDDEGRPMSVDKEGNLQVPFAFRGQATVDALLDAITSVLRLINEEAGIPGFLAFGALLGAVRDGHLIGHDADADVGYLSRHRDLVGVARESFELERIMRRAGWQTWRFSTADFKVVVPDPEGGRAIDVFGGFVVDDVFYLMPNVSTPYRESMLLPLGEVELEGRKVIAPADPTALLEATYGPGWKVPDPSFKFQPSPRVVRRLDGWTRGNIHNRGHWWPFYDSRSSADVPEQPSPFARWVREREPELPLLIDIGTGTGRDALWFAREGQRSLGLDYVPTAVGRAGFIAERDGIPGTFETFNLYDVRQVLAMGARLAHREEPATIYARFLVHALEDEGRHNLWRVASMGLRRGGRLYLEFRTGQDSDAEHEFGEHFRKYLHPDVVVAEIEARGGHIEHREEGHGMAVYKQEDPHVARLVASWQR